MSDRHAAVIRLLVPLYSGLNLTLMAFGYDPMPFAPDQVEAAVLSVAGTAGTIYVWWKNNNLTRASQKAQRYLDGLKNNTDRKE